jgi:hypothetical protein
MHSYTTCTKLSATFSHSFYYSSIFFLIKKIYSLLYTFCRNIYLIHFSISNSESRRTPATSLWISIFLLLSSVNVIYFFMLCNISWNPYITSGCNARENGAQVGMTRGTSHKGHNIVNAQTHKGVDDINKRAMSRVPRQHCIIV